MHEERGTHYDTLGCSPSSSSSQIKSAYKRAAKHWHPDKAHPEDKALAHARFKEVAEAYHVLGNPRTRRLYDLYLAYRSQGYVEVPDPQGEYGSYVRVPFRSWEEFKTYFGGSVEAGAAGATGHGGSYDNGDGEEDPNDSPISILEWLVAGGVLVAVLSAAVWHHQRREWLAALPYHIWSMHVEYTMPLGLLMSPFFFGNVSFEEASDWLRAAMDMHRRGSSQE
eukprot:gnl/TRDRNA2_/TRDRNA2_189462_c0_seq1.p2 gnl/TRDRNA2_/TRDRNA2_189462_c0~~gnl/TRDRNA2_/TRDRNA2_189462_c0_seq1.p2  ORF type:complete len:224 (-),score=43.92 gnl/TRDRNA2_/TRDRNA2_189462_c0_seq1:100-771(-)